MKAGQIVSIAAACLLVWAWSMIAAIDSQQLSERQQSEYCRNVKSGAWPDYAKAYKDECGGNPPKYFPKSVDGTSK